MTSGAYCEPFGIRMRGEGGVETLPVARVAFRSTKRSQWFTFILAVDSGASYTALPQIDAEPLGVAIHHGERVAVSGIGGEVIPAWSHKMTVEIGDMRVQIPVLFLERNDAPRVLGRAGILKIFSIILDGVEQRTGFIHRRSTQYRAMKRVLDRLG